MSSRGWVLVWGCPAEGHSFFLQGFYSQLCSFRNSESVGKVEVGKCVSSDTSGSF